MQNVELLFTSDQFQHATIGVAGLISPPKNANTSEGAHIFQQLTKSIFVDKKTEILISH